MKSFRKDTRGSAPLWAAFVAIILCALSMLIYTGAMINSKYHMALTELERTINISVDKSMINENVRDLILSIPSLDSITMLENNLVQAGYVHIMDGSWVKAVDGKMQYCFQDLQAVIIDDYMDITTTFSISLPWDVGLPSVTIPIHVQAKVLYLG